jgi:hypothetical protein
MPRRIAGAALFAAAAVAAAWAAWPQPPVGHALESQVGVITTVLLLAGLPLLARRFFGAASAGLASRSLRVSMGAAVLGLMPALAIVEVFANAAPRQPAYLNVFHAVQGSGGVPGMSSGGPPWPGEIVILLITAGYVAVIGWLTSQRSRVTRATLAIGAGGGLTLGLVMYLVAPLGLGKGATDPWLPGSDVDPLVALAWILLVAGPLAVGVIAARRCRGPDGSVPPWETRIRQGIAAGLLANVIGAVFVTALGAGTIALMLRSAALRHWLYHGQHLSALALYRHELYTSQNTMGYALICLAFPVIGLIMGAAVAGTMPAPREPGGLAVADR